MATLEAVVNSMADRAGGRIAIVTGDTKVVRARRRISCLSTPPGSAPSRRIFAGGAADRAGDVLLVSGTLGDHGATILNLREQMGLDGALSSDCAVLTPLIQTLRALPGVKALRDATRGGVNAVAHEFAAASGCGIELHERSCR
jgi:hydrogenase expression/formation protein HypE